MRILRPLFAAALATVLAVSSAAATDRRVVSFGDSLSDNGNIYALTDGTYPPSPPYFEGRFSNGPVWPEILSEGPQRGITQAIDNAADTNFAVGGATAGASGGEIPSIGLQIGAYLAGGGRFAASDVVTLFGGANDLLGLRPPTTPQRAVTEARMAANAMGAHLLAVLGAKARTVVILNLPPLEKSPRADALGEETRELFEVATRAFNARLAARVDAARKVFPRARIVLVDARALFSAVIDSPKAFGFRTSSQVCLDVVACRDSARVQDGYVFFDDIHPTTRAHAILAAIVEAEIE